MITHQITYIRGGRKGNEEKGENVKVRKRRSEGSKRRRKEKGLLRREGGEGLLMGEG